MKRIHTTFYVLGIALAGWAGVAAADEAQPTQVTAQKVSASATVEKIDAKKRELTLRNDRGDTMMMEVPENVTRLDAVKKGDKINVDYYESVTLSLKSPEKGAMPSASESSMTERSPGKLPGGMTGRKIVATATVMKIDKAENKLTIKGPEGQVDTIKVSDPAMQPQLGQLKKGDRIQASYTEAMAVSVIPKNKEP